MISLKFHRPLVGIEIGEGLVRVAQVLKEKRLWRLVSTAEVPFPEETLKLSYKTQNINDPEAFLNTVREAMRACGARAGRVGLSVPNEITRVLFQQYRELPPSRKGTERMLMWWAKRNLGFPAEEAKVSYAELGESAPGERALLVTFCSEEVIREYEMNLKGLGLEPAIIRPAGINQLNFYGPRIPPRGTVGFLGLFERFFNVFVIEDGALRFHYGKKGSYSDIHFFHDLEMVLMLYTNEDPSRTPERIYFASEIGLEKELEEGLRSLSAADVEKLDEGDLLGPTEGEDGGGALDRVAAYASAIGAAQSLG
jgi:hypothetical protein